MFMHMRPADTTKQVNEVNSYYVSTRMFRVKLTNTETIPDAEIVESLGIARGNTVEARNVGRDITQGLRNVVGGELKAYSDLLTKARDEAIDRMAADAEEMGADAVVNVRLETSQITNGGSEVLAYGTAVKLR